MIPQVKYVNSINQTVEFNNTTNLACNLSNLNDWSYDYETLNDRFSTIYTKPSTKTFQVYCASTPADAAEYINNVYDICAYDLAQEVTGRLYVGSWYMAGYIIASTKTRYVNAGLKQFELTFVCEQPKWIKEKHYRFNQGLLIGDGLDLPYNYPHDFASLVGATDITNDAYNPCDFEIKAYGAGEDPLIHIGNNAYGVSATLLNAEYLTIDSGAKTITKTNVDGIKTNLFNQRAGDYKEGSGSYVFQRIPTGTSHVTWSGITGFDLTIYEKRDEWKAEA